MRHPGPFQALRVRANTCTPPDGGQDSKDELRDRAACPAAMPRGPYSARQADLCPWLSCFLMLAAVPTRRDDP